MAQLPAPPARTAVAILVHGGQVVGRLPAVPVATPWWQDSEPAVAAIRERHGIDVVILRLLEAERDAPPGGCVTYLAEVGAPPNRGSLEPGLAFALDDHPLRQPYARPGGPAADLEWARAALDRNGIAVTRPPVQVRTWNLSSLWRLPTGDGDVWLKVVPSFFAHEGALIDVLADAPVPHLIARDGARVLMREIPGRDLYEPDPDHLKAMVRLLIGLQLRWAGRAADILATGASDWRATALHEAVADVVARTARELEGEEVAVLSSFVADLPQRLTEIAGCGLTDTLVHGDVHPGNFRGGGQAPLTLLDWGDAGFGHPLLDLPAFLERVPPSMAAMAKDMWLQLWRHAVPGSDPEQASDLIAPVAAAKQAAVYRGFLDNIEPCEHPYHRSDPARWLRRTASLLRG